MFDKLLHHVLGHLGGDGKADAHIATGRRQNRRIDTDQLTTQVDQCPTGVARINGRIGLDKAFIAFNAQACATQRGNDAASHRLAEPEGVTNGDHKIANPQTGGIGNGNLGKSVRLFQLQYRQIHFLIHTHQFRRQFTAIGKGDFDIVRVLDHMGVGQHIAFSSIHNHPGAGTGSAALRGPLAFRHVEKATKERIIHQRIARRPYPGFDGNIHHRRRGFFQHGRQRGKRVPFCRDSRQGRLNRGKGNA